MLYKASCWVVVSSLYTRVRKYRSIGKQTNKKPNKKKHRENFQRQNSSGVLDWIFIQKPLTYLGMDYCYPIWEVSLTCSSANKQTNKKTFIKVVIHLKESQVINSSVLSLISGSHALYVGCLVSGYVRVCVTFNDIQTFARIIWIDTRSCNHIFKEYFILTTNSSVAYI